MMRHRLKRGESPQKEELVLEMRMQPMREPAPQERERTAHHDGFGMLPANAPLANPYVPFQRNNPRTYPAKQGAVRGTLFPGLDLPYMGMVNEGTLGETHLHELQALAFALTELGEYLDTHADDQDAFDLFRSYAELYHKGRKEYEKMHGPLTQMGAAMGEKYRWLHDPWPWEYAANDRREG